MHARVLTILTILLAVMMAVGRGWGLWYRGLMDHDEGHALLNANTWWRALRWALAKVSGGEGADAGIGALGEQIHREGGTLYSAGKLGYSLLVAAVSLPGEVTTGVGLALAWAAGLMMALLAGGLALQYSRSRIAAAITALGCLASPLLTGLSREVSGTMWALVFGLGALLVVQGSSRATGARRRWILGLLGGMLFAYGFSCHFNLAPFILASYFAAACYASYGVAPMAARLRVGFISVVPAGIGGLCGLALVELATRALDFKLRASHPDFLPLSGELRQISFLINAQLERGLYGDGAIGWGADAWAVYGWALWKEGPAWLLLFLVLVPWLLMRSRAATRAAAGWQVAPAITLLIIPAIFYAAYAYRVERALGMCIMASWVIIGVVLGPIIENTLRQNASRKFRLAAASIAVLTLVQLGWSAMAWASYARLRSPLPMLVADTFAAPAAAGKRITAGSFYVGFAPQWKWAIVEHRRQENTQTSESRGGPVVDFSTFNRPDIVFTDPSTWRRMTAEFRVTREQVQAGSVIASRTSAAPAWTVQSVLLPPQPTTDSQP